MAEIIPELMLEYFEATVKAYHNWGKDLDHPCLYSLHSGFTEEGKKIPHYDELREYNYRLVDFIQIADGFSVLDAGCGSGTISYTIADKFPDVRVFGINLCRPQIETAQAYKVSHRIPNVHFSYQNYNQTAFIPEVFDRVVFCESFCYSLDKAGSLQEVYRLLKFKGCVVIADCFTRDGSLSDIEQEQMRTFEEGFRLTPVVSIGKIVDMLSETGFSLIDIQDISKNILPSASAIAANAQMRLNEKSSAPEIITRSRYGCVAMELVMRSGGMKYFFIRAEKT